MADVVELPWFTALRQTQQAPEDVRIRFAATDGKEYDVTFKRGMTGPLVATLLKELANLPSDRGQRALETQPLKAIGADAVIGPQGEPGISIRLEGNLRLTIKPSKEALDGLRAVLVQLDSATKPPTRTSH